MQAHQRDRVVALGYGLFHLIPNGVLAFAQGVKSVSGHAGVADDVGCLGRMAMSAFLGYTRWAIEWQADQAPSGGRLSCSP